MEGTLMVVEKQWLEVPDRIVLEALRLRAIHTRSPYELARSDGLLPGRETNMCIWHDPQTMATVFQWKP